MKTMRTNKQPAKKANSYECPYVEDIYQAKGEFKMFAETVKLSLQELKNDIQEIHQQLSQISKFIGNTERAVDIINTRLNGLSSVKDELQFTKGVGVGLSHSAKILIVLLSAGISLLVNLIPHLIKIFKF